MVRRPTARDPPPKEPNGRRILWCGAALDADGSQQGVVPDHGGGRRPDAGKDARRPAPGARLIGAILAWVTPDRQLQPDLNRFDVRVSEAGDTWIERLRW